MLKRCQQCHLEKEITEFYTDKTRKDGFRQKCKPCQLKAKSDWIKANREKERSTRLKNQYNITIQIYKEMLLKQNNCCYICKTINPGNKMQSFQIDHDHNTGKVRGLLCPKCNRGLGFFNDNVELLRTAALYLDSFRVK